MADITPTTEVYWPAGWSRDYRSLVKEVSKNEGGRMPVLSTLNEYLPEGPWG